MLPTGGKTTLWDRMAGPRAPRKKNDMHLNRDIYVTLLKNAVHLLMPGQLASNLCPNMMFLTGLSDFHHDRLLAPAALV